MRTPTSHLLGSDRERLLANYQAAEQAVLTALETVKRCAPHGRDYYLQRATPGYHGDASVEAMDEHRMRVRHLTAIHDEYVILCQSIMLEKTS